VGEVGGQGRPNLSLEESARRAGVAAWEEKSLYEVVGSWVPSTSHAPAKVFFDSASQHHAWRAALWLDRLAGRLVARQPGPPAGPAGPGAPAAAMTALAGITGDAARLGVYCRVVLPRAVVGYRHWLRECSPVSDRPVARVLGIVLADLVTDWQEGCEVLAELVSGAGPGAVAEAAESSAEIERLLIHPHQPGLHASCDGSQRGS